MTEYIGEILKYAPHAMDEIIRLRTFEYHWFYNGLWRKYWNGKPDAYYFDKDTGARVPLIDARKLSWVNSAGEEQSFGYLKATWVYPDVHIGVVPLLVNDFVRRWFGTVLFGFGVAWYWMPAQVHESLVVGGRGSGKTVQIGLVSLTWAAIHPGEPWGHFAISEDQAHAPYHEVYEAMGSVPHYINGVENFASFSEVFVAKAITSPRAEVRFRPWDAKDTGNKWAARTIGVQAKGTRVRTLTFGNVSMDESTKNISGDDIIATVASTARGANRYLLSQLDEEVQKAIEKARTDYMILRDTFGASADKVREAQKRYDDLLQKYGVNRLNRVYIMGNPSDALWLRRRASRPRSQVFVWRASMYDNPMLSPSEQERLERNYSTADERKVELEGYLPESGAGIFSSYAVGRAVERWKARGATFTARPENWKEHVDYSVYGPWLYLEEPNKMWNYIISADPGMGKIPNRNAWAIVVHGVHKTDQRVRIFGFRWGNVPGVDTDISYRPFLNALDQMIHLFPNPIVAFDAGGQQEGLLESAVFQGITNIYPVKLSQKSKASVINVYSAVVMPMLEMPEPLITLQQQMKQYDFNDNGLAQDTVMAAVLGTPFIYKLLVGLDVHPKEITNPYMRADMEEVGSVVVSLEERRRLLIGREERAQIIKKENFTSAPFVG